MLNFELVDERICYLRLQGKFFNITIICVHAPTENNDNVVKSSFYDRLDRVYDTIPKHDAVIIMGGMNTKVSKDHLAPCTGISSLHEISNVHGDRLCDFATSIDLIISSTIFPHKNIHLQTWISPDGLTAKQIDHVMTSRRHGTDLTDIRSQQGVDCDSDHFMMRIK
jgi:endonuclease/exonuclease/phosphatase family metal-dependent hydrolase